MQSRVIHITSIFPAPVPVIWEKVKRLETLQYIAAPYAYFEPVGNMEMIWQEGAVFKFRFRLFGIIPLGVHTISVLEFNRDSLSIYTHEENKFVPTWNHRIILKELDSNYTQYSDQVEIYAGCKTVFVCWWSYIFYKHRQKKWLELLNSRQG
jgi:hypothetical protein